MAVAATVAALFTACFVALVLLLDARAAGWLGPVVFGLGVFMVLFYGWAIYSIVHPLPPVRSRGLEGAADTTEAGGSTERDSAP